MTVLVGTSGWQYRHWRYRYFKRGTPQNRWFEQVMSDFRTVELNVTFYRLPRAEVFAGWYDRAPADAHETECRYDDEHRVLYGAREPH